MGAFQYSTKPEAARSAVHHSAHADAPGTVASASVPVGRASFACRARGQVHATASATYPAARAVGLRATAVARSRAVAAVPVRRRIVPGCPPRAATVK
jgi:hypothetical protein